MRQATFQMPLKFSPLPAKDSLLSLLTALLNTTNLFNKLNSILGSTVASYFSKRSFHIAFILLSFKSLLHYGKAILISTKSGLHYIKSILLSSKAILHYFKARLQFIKTILHRSNASLQYIIAMLQSTKASLYYLNASALPFRSIIKSIFKQNTTDFLFFKFINKYI